MWARTTAVALLAGVSIATALNSPARASPPELSGIHFRCVPNSFHVVDQHGTRLGTPAAIPPSSQSSCNSPVLKARPGYQFWFFRVDGEVKLFEFRVMPKLLTRPSDRLFEDYSWEWRGSSGAYQMTIEFDQHAPLAANVRVCLLDKCATHTVTFRFSLDQTF
jgi:hypothetical protein